MDPDQLDRVDDFLTRVRAVEEEIGLDLGVAVRDADIRNGMEAARPARIEDVPPLESTSNMLQSDPLSVSPRRERTAR
jgi:8-oxo-dGTP pyrophosphatase MutT (NUDIX family)